MRIGSERGDATDTARRARAGYRLRRARTRYFDSALFGEPAWDMLLDLYIARCEGRPRSTKSAWIGAAVPQTTALRWLGRLERAGLIRRWQDSADRRLTRVDLTDSAFARMALLLASQGAPAEELRVTQTGTLEPEF